MPKNTPPRTIDQKRASSGGYTFVSSGSGGGGVTDHGLLTGLGDDDHTQYLTNTRGDLRYVPLTRQVTGTGGLTGGGALSGDLSLSLAAALAGDGLAWQTGNSVLKVGAGAGLTVAADSVALTTPGTLAVGSTNSASGNHTHAVTSSANPGAAAALLATDSSGVVQLTTVKVGSAAITLNSTDNVAAGPDVQFGTNGLIAAETSLYLSIDSNNDSTTAALIIGSNAPHSGFTELARLTETGRLGIGNNAPAYELDVTGSARATVAVYTGKVQTPTIDTASGALTLSPATDVLFDPTSNLVKLQSGVNFQSYNFASQTTGMRVTQDGQGDFRYLFTDELHAKAFIADLEQALAGGQIIAKSVTKLSSDWLVTPRGSATTITVDDLPGAPNIPVFESGDVVGVRTFSRTSTPGGLDIGTAYGVVSSYADGTGANEGTQSWTFTRASSTALGSGSLAGNTPVAKGAIVIDYGVSGNGYHEVSAVDGLYGANAPYSQVVTWSGGSPSATNAKTIRTRLGNLYGIFGVAGEFGLFAGSYNSGSPNASQYLRMSNQGVRLNNVPLQLWSGTQRVNIDAAGTDVWFKDAGGTTKLAWDGSQFTINALLYVQDASRLDGAVTLGASGGIYQGTGTFASPTTGLKIWRDSSIGRIGGYNAGTLQWYANTDGKFYAGAGAVVLDADGAKLRGGSSLWEQGTALEWYATPASKTTLYGRLGIARYNTGLDITRMTLEAKQVGVDPADIVIRTLNAAGTEVSSMWLTVGGLSVNGDMVPTVGNANTFTANQTITGRLIADGIDLGAAEYVTLGAYERVWRPNQQIAATNQGSYGPTLTYDAQYSSGWKSIAAGAPTAMGVTEGRFWFATGGNPAGANVALTWTNRLVITSTDATFTGNISASGDITAGGILSASGTLAVSGAATLSSTLGVTGATTLSSTLGVGNAIYLTELGSAPAWPTNDTGGNSACSIYMKGDKLVVGYQQSGVMNYFTLNLRSTNTTAQWAYSNTAP